MHRSEDLFSRDYFWPIMLECQGWRLLKGIVDHNHETASEKDGPIKWGKPETLRFEPLWTNAVIAESPWRPLLFITSLFSFFLISLALFHVLLSIERLLSTNVNKGEEIKINFPCNSKGLVGYFCYWHNFDFFCYPERLYQKNYPWNGRPRF